MPIASVARIARSEPPDPIAGFPCRPRRGKSPRRHLIPADAPPPMPEPEREFDRPPRADGGDAYSRYNALLRELASFAAALERRLGKP